MTLFPGVALVTGAASGIFLFLISSAIFIFFFFLYISNTVLISSLGIGRATAVSFALEGCSQIAICDRNLEGLHGTVRLMKDVSRDVEILVNQVDMLEEAQIENMVQAAVDKWGRVDYAVNCAG